jgi:hypothetical protein
VSQCPLIGVDRKWQAGRQTDANDPLRTPIASANRRAVVKSLAYALAADDLHHRVRLAAAFLHGGVPVINVTAAMDAFV